MRYDDWHGCYNEGWNGEIVSDAFAHPAKFARGLIKRIYQHIIDEGWAQPGDTILDPFGGVALGGLDAMRHGLHFVGVELEPKFVKLGQQNIALWNDLAKRATAWGLDGWGSAVLLQGDSRQLASIVGGAAVACSSPPYAGSQQVDSRNKMQSAISNTWRARWGQITAGQDPANLANLPEGDHAAVVSVSSPPYVASVNQQGVTNDARRRIERKRAAGVDVSRSVNVGGPNSVLNRAQNYGETDGQLGAMPEGSHALAISSPPYAASLASDDPDRRGGLYRDPKRRGDKTLTAGYGCSPGQLGAMSVSSPPYEGSHVGAEDNPYSHTNGKSLGEAKNAHLVRSSNYGEDDNQLGNTHGDDFWSAARQIVEQLALVLRPGAHAVWILKAFVRNGEYVDFPLQWMRLCEACGFETLHWHRAWLIEERGAQYTLDGNIEEKRIERKSFFRRLAERNGSPRVDYEVVLCMVRR